MIVRYEDGFTLDGWYQNTDAFHHLQDAIDTARSLIAEDIARKDVCITEQHFRTEEDYLKRDNMRRSMEMGLDEADKLLRDQNQTPGAFIPPKARYAVSSAEFLTLLGAGDRHLATIHNDAAPHDATIRHWTMYASDAGILECPICGDGFGITAAVRQGAPPSQCRYGFCRTMKQSYVMYEREGTGQDLTSDQLPTLIFRATEEATIALLTESQNPDYSTTIGAFFGEATEDTFGTHEDIETTDQLLARRLSQIYRKCTIAVYGRFTDGWEWRPLEWKGDSYWDWDRRLRDNKPLRDLIYYGADAIAKIEELAELTAKLVDIPQPTIDLAEYNTIHQFLHARLGKQLMQSLVNIGAVTTMLVPPSDNEPSLN